MNTEELKEARDLANQEAGKAYRKLNLLKDIYEKAQSDYCVKSKRFHELDYQLSLIDGRLEKLPPAKSGQKVQKTPELTMDQLKKIAEKLGIAIPIETVEEELILDEEG